MKLDKYTHIWVINNHGINWWYRGIPYPSRLEAHKVRLKDLGITPIIDEEVTIDCACHHPDHLLRISIVDGDLILSVRLNQYYPWYKRIYLAILYIFGYSIKSQYDEIILNKSGQHKLRDLIDVSIKTT